MKVCMYVCEYVNIKIIFCEVVIYLLFMYVYICKNVCMYNVYICVDVVINVNTYMYVDIKYRINNMMLDIQANLDALGESMVVINCSVIYIHRV